eukprot:g2770.t2
MWPVKDDGWAAKSAYLEAKSKKRHLAYLKILAVEEKKEYPEHEDFHVALPLGDPQCSPVWTAVVQQLEIGEKAKFTLSRKALDYNPEGLAPDDYCSSWEVELLRVLDVEDVNEDFQQLLDIESSGGKERAEDLDNVAVHWRVRRWMPEGTFCIASSRERIAILPGYGLVPIEDQNAPPVQIAVGEGQQEAVEVIAAKVGPGGQGHLYLKSQAMKANRPAGCVIMDVEVVAMDPCRGPGTPGWKGWQNLINEREIGDQWLDEADGRRKQLETFGTLRKSSPESELSRVKRRARSPGCASSNVREPSCTACRTTPLRGRPRTEVVQCRFNTLQSRGIAAHARGVTCTSIFLLSFTLLQYILMIVAARLDGKRNHVLQKVWRIREAASKEYHDRLDGDDPIKGGFASKGSEH